MPLFSFFYFDWTWLLLIPAFVITIWAQAKVSGAYKRYSKVPIESGVTAQRFAQDMMRQNGVMDVSIQPVKGDLTDHYDPRTQTIGLSEGIYGKSTVAAVAVAAHEAGHVLQRSTNYGPMKVRTALVPVVNVATMLAFPILIVGLVFAASPTLASIGVWLYFASVIFQLVTLPVEFNASKRALQNISASGVMTASEQVEAKKMLTAAAMTYVAAMLASFLSFLRLLLISRGSRR